MAGLIFIWNNDKTDILAKSLLQANYYLWPEINKYALF